MNSRFPTGGPACRVPFQVFAAWLLACAAAAWSATPQVGGIAPFGGQRGTQIQVEFQGARLTDAQEVMFYEPGIKATELVGAPASLKATLTIDPQCRLGQHAFRIRSATGISNLRVFSVGAMKDVPEVEPNNDFAKPQPIELDVTINGVVTNEDVDYFLIEAKKGERISVEVEGLRLASNPGGLFDPAVAILDRDRFDLAHSDDAPLLHQDSACGLLVPEDGQYIIQIRETAFGGSAAGKYRAHIGHFPRPTSVLPLGGKFGELVEVRWLGGVAEERTEKVQLPKVGVASFGLFTQESQGISPTAIPFRLSEFGNSLEAEPNDDAEQATKFEIPGAANGIIAKPGDVDRFKFTAKKGQPLEARVFARSLGSPLDSVLTINRITKEGKLGPAIGTNDDTGGPDSYVRFSVPEDGDYLVEIRDQLRSGGRDFAYRVEVSPIKPSLTMALPERVQYVDTTMPLPKGNRLAVMMSAQRTDFSGDLEFQLQDLPPGVQAEVLPMPGNRSETVMLFTAAADAPLGGSMLNVIGRTTDPKQPVEGHLRQRSGLARYQQTEMLSFFSERVPLVVTEASPFTIDIVEPKVPLVRSGAMDLKVIAKRKEGFTGPIAVKLLYNPPGVGSSTSATIPDGKDEVLLPMTATAAAELKTWKIVVLGEATVGEGQVLASTGFANLEIAESYLAFTFQSSTVEQGQETELLVKMEKRKDFEGSAHVELVGLPNGATAEPLDVTKDSSELEFKIKTLPTAAAGRHKTLLARVVITEKGEPVVHMLGPGDLRIDTPLPPKPNATTAAAGAPKPAAAAAADKRLNRLERLRKEREQSRAEPDKK